MACSHRTLRTDSPVRGEQYMRVVLAAVAANGVTLLAAEAAQLTERDAVEAALQRPALQSVERGRARVAESDVLEASRPPNPVLALERESANLAGGQTTEFSVRISQPLDLAGRRSLRRQAANARLQATYLDVQQQRLRTVAEVRTAFADALYRERLADAHSDWLRRIEAAVAIVGKLAMAGEVSGYDRRRVAREGDAARARLAGVRADQARARELLAGLIDRPEGELGTLHGELIPAAAPALEVLQAALTERPDLAGLQSKAQAFEYERKSYERPWLPELNLGIGARRIRELGASDTGLILGLSVPIPLFDRGQAARQRALAQADTLLNESRIQQALAEAELRGAWRQTEELRIAAAEFHSLTLTGSRELSRIAEAAYGGGEVGLLELLDAYRAEFDAQATALDLALRARRARIELDLISGREGHD